MEPFVNMDTDSSDALSDISMPPSRPANQLDTDSSDALSDISMLPSSPPRIPSPSRREALESVSDEDEDLATNEREQPRWCYSTNCLASKSVKTDDILAHFTALKFSPLDFFLEILD